MMPIYSQLSGHVDRKQSLVRYQIRHTTSLMRGVDLERLRAAMAEAGMDQSSLARAAGCTPGAINQIIQGNVRQSKFLPDIADALGVSLRWLRGQPVQRGPTDSAPPQLLPQPPRVFLEVTLPSENALARMFEGLLELVDQSAPKDELARELAQLLPIGLSQLQGRLTETAVAKRSVAAEPPVPATADRGPPQ